MKDPKDAKNNDANEPSFADPHDPRWSQGPQAAPAPDNRPGPVGNPYQDQPLYAPPGTPQNPYPNQPPHAPQVNPQAGPYAQQQPMHGQPMGHASATGVSNVLGIISMVAGILGLLTTGMLFLPQLAAVVCGHLSLRRERPHRGFAIAGLVTGYVGLAIGFLVFAGFLAAFAGAASVSL
ncbi:DUF4190 domain-containing protein [Paeniglutamicibacter kerguelensis]|uniref:DUF4190 domain-containing protein n=1 Tax=Paeniglutamicibacter kerguelensis TaxID=254788 RepID=A0ABS4XIL7_9MICC|nr:DUF4190 domain-containing protein [Paeniglutamicibacter kerguelensis]MBP2388307.1 hypothetical protein [Paeniglutamicibacter kerguelensis]